MNFALLADTAPTLTENMTSFLGNIGSFFTWSIDQLKTCLGVVSGNAGLIILCLAMPICGFVVGLLGRLIRVN